MTQYISSEDQRRFEQEAARFRSVLAKARSVNQLQIFDFLVERSTDHRSPKEVEIALALSGDAASLETGVDSGVRVYVHRLRKRLEDYYRDKPGLRLVIPKGEYRIVMEVDASASENGGRLPSLVKALTAHPVLSAGLALILCALLALAGWTVLRFQQGSGMASGQPGRSAAGIFSAHSPLIVIGDRMFVAESEDQRSVQRITMEPDIQSRDELGEYLMSHPEAFYRLYDFNLHFAPIASVAAAWRIEDEIRKDDGTARKGSTLLPMSALTPDMARSRALLYVGRLSQLGILEPYVFAGSRLKLAAFDRLADDQTNRVFVGDVYTETHEPPQVDYGYIAFRSGPEGHVLGVLAGLGDQGTAAMVDLLADQRALAALRARMGNARFEALYEVRMREGFAAKRRLIMLNKLR